VNVGGQIQGIEPNFLQATSYLKQTYLYLELVMKSNVLLATAAFLALGSCDVLKQTATQMATETLTQATSGTGGVQKPVLSTSEAASGLKEALVQGVLNGTGRLGKVGAFAQNPSLKIPLPPEVQQVEKKIRDNRMLNSLISPELDKVVEAMNTGAENSMKLAVPVFKQAVTDMSFADAMGVLTGGDGAATHAAVRPARQGEPRRRAAGVWTERRAWRRGGRPRGAPRRRQAGRRRARPGRGCSRTGPRP
jgi:hypothetical protein